MGFREKHMNINKKRPENEKQLRSMFYFAKVYPIITLPEIREKLGSKSPCLPPIRKYLAYFIKKFTKVTELLRVRRILVKLNKAEKHCRFGMIIINIKTQHIQTNIRNYHYIVYL